jgi:ssRNA-specific RNase YbeY (16S rRNA maturation enzyme)
LNVKQELLKLNSAVQQQKKRRTIGEQQREFNNDSKPLPDALLDYLNSIEILNRQSLPLRSNYNRKVQEYFKKMINFNYENEFNLENEDAIASWLSVNFVRREERGRNQLYLCDDEYLHKINLEYLKHDDLTDIISFDYTLGNEIHGDILFLWNVFRKTRRISKCL